MTADVEGREWVRSERPKPARPPSATPLSSAAAATRSASSASSSAKVQNESYFARLGGANATRSANLPPSQGGKYSGFGSTPAPDMGGASSSAAGVPTLDEFSRDPVAALTKGFGFFTTQVAKSAKTVNEAVIMPTAQKIAEADLAKHVAVVGQKVSDTGKYGFETINRFVDNAGGPTYSRVSQTGSRGAGGIEDEHGDFWDNFGEASAEKEKDKHSALGTGAVKKSTMTGMAGGKKRDDWGDDDW